MKPSLHLRQSQHLSLTPQLQQAIRLLQLSTLEINQEVARLLDENPLLEREDDDVAMPYAHGDAAVSSPQESAVESKSTESDEIPQHAEEEWQKMDEDWNEPSSSAARAPDDEENTRKEIVADKPSLREHLFWQLSMSQLDACDREIIGMLT